jgi:hypothetical protein
MEALMKCYVCGANAVRIFQRTNMCEQHGRFYQMQRTAKADKKYVPSLFELEKLVPKNMECPDCKTMMNWRDHNNRNKGAVLQHYRNGTIAITCMSCNTKHGLMLGDSYCDLPENHKYCNKCKTIKPLFDFGKRGKKEGEYPKSHCKLCSLENQKKWRNINYERYIELNKKHNDKRKKKNEPSTI